MRLVFRPFTTIFAALTLCSCGSGEAGDSVSIAFLEDRGSPIQDGVRLSTAGQHVRAATAEGLVTFDAQGNVVPAMAERWIVTDGGRSYIFRLRNAEWHSGERVTGENTRAEILRLMAQLEGTTLGRDLDVVSEVRAMAGRVVEFRLKSPMPQFLQLLAQPEMGLRRGNQGMGPMGLRKVAVDGSEVLSFFVLSPESRSLPEMPNWQDQVRTLRLWDLPDAEVLKRFYAGDLDVILNGRLATFPMADTGPLSLGTVRLDPTIGMFGLSIRSRRGVLADKSRRQAVSMAIDRAAIVSSFAIGGWLASNRLVPVSLGGGRGQGPDWAGQSMAQRRSQSVERVAQWRERNGDKQPKLTLYLPPGPGGDRLFAMLNGDLDKVGIALTRVSKPANADLELTDNVARYSHPRWFLNQINCRNYRGPCAPEADRLMAEALTEEDPEERDSKISRAAKIADDAHVFIALGAPIRWSLVRGGFEGYESNPSGQHPLFPMANRPI